MDVLQLSNLLSSCCTGEGYEELDNKDTNTNSYCNKKVITPGTFGVVAPTTQTSTQNNTNTESILKSSSNSSTTKIKNQKIDKNNDDIWNVNEIPSEESIISARSSDNATKVQPKYKIYYKQTIGTHDVFLNHDKLTSSCDRHRDSVIVKIYFPNCTCVNDIKLDVGNTKFMVESKDEKLSMYLPQTVMEEYGKAIWNNDNNILIVTLPIDKE